MKNETCNRCGASFVVGKDKNYCDECYEEIVFPMRLSHESPEDEIVQRKFKQVKGGKK